MSQEQSLYAKITKLLEQHGYQKTEEITSQTLIEVYKNYEEGDELVIEWK